MPTDIPCTHSHALEAACLLSRASHLYNLPTIPKVLGNCLCVQCFPVPAGLPPESSAGLVHLGSNLAAPRASSKLAFGDGELRTECSRELSPGTLAISQRPAAPKQGLCAQIQPPTLKAQGRAPPCERAGKFPLLLRPLCFFSIPG